MLKAPTRNSCISIRLRPFVARAQNNATVAKQAHSPALRTEATVYSKNQLDDNYTPLSHLVWIRAMTALGPQQMFGIGNLSGPTRLTPPVYSKHHLTRIHVVRRSPPVCAEAASWCSRARVGAERACWDGEVRTTLQQDVVQGISSPNNMI